MRIGSIILTAMLTSGAAIGQTTQPAATPLAAPPSAPPATAPTTQPSRIYVRAVTHDTNYTRPQPERLIVTLDLWPDPSLHAAYIPTIAQADKAEDDRHNSLLYHGDVPRDLFPEIVTSGAADRAYTTAPPPPAHASRWRARTAS